MRKGDACILQSALEIMENIVLHRLVYYIHYTQTWIIHYSIYSCYTQSISTCYVQFIICSVYIVLISILYPQCANGYGSSIYK